MPSTSSSSPSPHRRRARRCRRRAAPPQAASTMARSRRFLGANTPGVSTKTSWLSPSLAMPRSGTRVVCTLCETIDTLAPTSALTSVDLPALGAPMMATKPQRWASGVGCMASLVRRHSCNRLRDAFALEQRSRRDCSAARFEAPSPRAGAHPSMRTSEVKRGAWSGPLRLTSTYSGKANPCLAPIPAAPILASARRWSRAVVLARPQAAHDRARRLKAGVEKDGAEEASMASARMVPLARPPLPASLSKGSGAGPGPRRGRHARRLRRDQAIVAARQLALAGGGKRSLSASAMTARARGRQ